MDKETVKNKINASILWDIDIENLDIDISKAQIIQRVLEYGEIDDWKLILAYYGLDTIVDVCKTLRTLDPVSLAFICAISHTQKTEYRCYHFSQSNPTLWNS